MRIWQKIGIVFGIVLLCLILSVIIFSKITDNKYQAYLKDLEAKGYKTTPKGLFPEGSDEDNAYIPLQKAADEFGKILQNNNLSTETLSNAFNKDIITLTNEEINSLKMTANQSTNIFELIKTASEKPFYNPKPDYSLPMIQWSPFIDRNLLNTSKLISFRSQIALRENYYNQALEDCILSLKLSNTYKKMPFLSLAMINNGIYKRNLILIKNISFVYDIPEKDMKEIIQLINPESFHNAFIKGLETELIYAFSMANQNKNTSINNIVLKNDLMAGQSVRIKHIEALKKTYSEYIIIEKEIEKNQDIPFYHPYLKLLYPFTQEPRMLYKTEAKAQTTRLALACELYKRAHGNFPASLENLIPEYFDKMPMDPFTGKPCIYKTFTDGSFVVYSVGENLKNESNIFTTVEEFESAIDKFAKNIDQREETDYDIIWLEKAK